jgi:hypothetical protein
LWLSHKGAAEAEGGTVQFGVGVTGVEPLVDSVQVRLSDRSTVRTDLITPIG